MPAGTGKTTIARLLAAMMKDVGYRPGNYAETTGTKVLMGGVKEWRLMLKDCEGGVLFLDEAYQVRGEPREPRAVLSYCTLPASALRCSCTPRRAQGRRASRS